MVGRPPRSALCAGGAYAILGDGERAEAEASAAIELYAAVPDSDRWDAGELAAHIDLSMARTMRGDLAGAAEAVQLGEQIEDFTANSVARTAGTRMIVPNE